MVAGRGPAYVVIRKLDDHRPQKDLIGDVGEAAASTRRCGVVGITRKEASLYYFKNLVVTFGRNW